MALNWNEKTRMEVLEGMERKVLVGYGVDVD